LRLLPGNGLRVHPPGSPGREPHDGNHTITIIAYDGARNSASAVRHVNVAAMPPGGGPTGRLPDVVVFLGIALIIAAVAGVAILLVRRRRPRDPSAAPPELAAWAEAPPPPPPT